MSHIRVNLSKKPIYCWWCGKKIERGEEYIVETLEDNETGSVYSIFFHKECFEEYSKQE